MDLLSSALNILLHLDQHLVWLAQGYGAWIYAILFIIIFCETGLVVTPFLPGDSLLFVAGTVAAAGEMNVHALGASLSLAAVLGNMTNFHIGRYLGPRIFSRGQDSWFLRKDYLDRTNAFYARHGGKTIVISRFMPIIRTYAPFVAGIGHMAYGRFLLFNLIGGLSWVLSLVYAGYFFGNIPWVKHNLTLVILGIIALSLMPGFIAYLRNRKTAS
jgi:membrane-associated protein